MEDLGAKEETMVDLGETETVDIVVGEEEIIDISVGVEETDHHHQSLIQTMIRNRNLLTPKMTWETGIFL